jgi:TRAP-type C4-dicarboxylate transport system permease small subunit
MSETTEEGAGGIVHALARWCAYIGGAVMTGLALMSVYSVIMRKFFDRPIQGDFELVQIGCAICVALLLPWCQLRGGNIIVDFFTTKASQRTQSVLDAIGSLMVALMAGAIAWRTGVGAVSVKAAGETSMIMGVPIWIGYAAMVPGLALTAVAALWTMAASLRGKRGAA